MPPISCKPIETRLEIRQAQPYVLTQTIADLSTTYTTTLTLGSYTLPPSPISTSTPATITVAPASPPAKTTTDSSGVVIGAVLGTFLGLAVLIALAWKCCFDGRSVLWNPRWDGEDESYRSGSPSLGSSRSSRSRRRVKRRGGFLAPRRRRRERRRNEYADSVRSPDRAYVRDRRGYDEEEWGEKRPRRTVRNGMAGWSFGGGVGRKSSRRSSRRRDWVESERIRMRFTTDD